MNKKTFLTTFTFGLVAYIVLFLFLFSLGQISFTYKVFYTKFYSKNEHATVGVDPADLYKGFDNSIIILSEPGSVAKGRVVFENYQSKDTKITVHTQDSMDFNENTYNTRHNFEKKPLHMSHWVSFDESYDIPSHGYLIEEFEIDIPDDVEREIYVMKLGIQEVISDEDAEYDAATGARINYEYAMNVYLDLTSHDDSLVNGVASEPFESRVATSRTMARIHLAVLVMNAMFLIAFFVTYNPKKLK